MALSLVLDSLPDDMPDDVKKEYTEKDWLKEAMAFLEKKRP